MPVWKLAGWHWSLLERRFRLRCNYVGASSTSRSPRLLLPSPWKRRIGAKLTMNVPVSRNARPEQCNSIYLLAAALRCNVYARKDGKKRENRRTMKGDERLWNNGLDVWTFSIFFYSVQDFQNSLIDRNYVAELL